MPSPSVTYSFTNGTTADATEVNTNFQDLINSVTDATKDLYMNDGHFGGTLTLDGAVTLGNGVGDNITISGSLNSSIPIKTTHSHDIGSATLGLRDAYFGSTGGAFTTKLSGSDVGASKTVVLFGHDIALPTVEGAAGYSLITDGAGVASWGDTSGSTHLGGYSITAAVASSALTITIKGSGGSDLSSSRTALFAFRNATLTTGQYNIVSLASNSAMTVTSGSTLGHTSAVECPIYVYAVNDAGTVSIGVSNTLYDEYNVYTTIAEGGAGAADSPTSIFTTNAHVSCPVRCIGMLRSTQATAGTWDTAISNIYTGTPGNFLDAADVGKVIIKGTATVPMGYLACDGSSLARATYSGLYAVIGTAFGTADANSFNIPDMRGRFPRGRDATAGVDPDAATRTAMATGGATGDNIGSLQADAFQGHKHTVRTLDSGGSGSNHFVYDGSSGSNNIGVPTDDGTNGTPRTAAESRPKNLNFGFFIKY